MNTRYKSKTAEWVRRAVLAVLLAVLLFALGRCIYRNRTVAEMNEYVTAFAYKGETYTYIASPAAMCRERRSENAERVSAVSRRGRRRRAVFDCPTSRPGADPICFCKAGHGNPRRRHGQFDCDRPNSHGRRTDYVPYRPL